MELKFFSLDEVKDFVKQLKGTRGGKDKDDETGGLGATGQTGGAPAPLMPPQQQPGGFQPPQSYPPQGQAQPQGFPGAGMPGVDPVVAQLVNRIVTSIDLSIAPVTSGGRGQSPEQALTWFRGQCGPEAANATLDQIKQHFLFKLPAQSLEGLAKLMGA